MQSYERYRAEAEMAQAAGNGAAFSALTTAANHALLALRCRGQAAADRQAAAVAGLPPRRDRPIGALRAIGNSEALLARALKSEAAMRAHEEAAERCAEEAAGGAAEPETEADAPKSRSRHG